MNAAMAGFGGTFVEARALGLRAQAATPMLGKVLTANEAAALLDRLT
jgi:hypothetical protein